MTHNTHTLTGLRAEIGWEFDPHLPVDDPVPVLTGSQRQGDVYILAAGSAGARPLDGDGLPFTAIDVVEGLGGRNPHTLVDLSGRCRWIAGGHGAFDVGTLVVPDGAECFLLHRQHGASGVGAGRFVLRRQREFAEEIRAVAD